MRVILADPQKAYWGIGLPCGYTLGRVLGFGNIGLWWRFAIALAVAAGVLMNGFQFNVGTNCELLKIA
ncbi:MAG: hypothetical protein KME25_06310 [Symplocastrum torsivum CPER-KK1]|uniref:Uncharacterized protein n=1 Tax=Symplocastrum torsivum CPER-KK1 TaxID=450513 RepID=A0A951PHS1_9CYAN|nr:hypothetical protein [Symplocastrum torsivum CPER-KK1]